MLKQIERIDQRKGRKKIKNKIMKIKKLLLKQKVSNFEDCLSTKWLDNYEYSPCNEYIILNIKKAALKYKKIFRKNGIKCFSKNYIGNKYKYFFKCKYHHFWDASILSVINSIKNKNSGCPYCAGKHNNISILNKIAKEKDLVCESKRYRGAYVKYKWKHILCGYRWKTTIYNIKKGCGCPKCSKRIFRTIKDAKKLAKERGWTLYSNSMKNVFEKLEWQCKLRHRKWKAAFHTVESGCGCPECAKNSKSVGERIARYCFETLFGVEFIKKKHDFILSKDGNSLELDGYNADLNVAFEYNGLQHYKNIRMYHKRKNSFKKRIENDSIKRLCCRKKKIILIEIPEMPFDKIFSYVISQCKKRNLKINIPNNLDIPYHIIFNSEYSPERIQRMAGEQGFVLITKFYVDAHYIMKFRHKRCGNITLASANSVQQGRLICKRCNLLDRNKENLNKFARFVESKGGHCLAKKYVNLREKLKIKFKKDIFYVSPHELYGRNVLISHFMYNQKKKHEHELIENTNRNSNKT